MGWGRGADRGGEEWKIKEMRQVRSDEQHTDLPRKLFSFGQSE